jgi:hypothetical protein
MRTPEEVQRRAIAAAHQALDEGNFTRAEDALLIVHALRETYGVPRAAVEHRSSDSGRLHLVEDDAS